MSPKRRANVSAYGHRSSDQLRIAKQPFNIHTIVHSTEQRPPRNRTKVLSASDLHWCIEMKHRFWTAAYAIFVIFLVAIPLRAQSVEQGIQLFDARKYAEAQAALLPQGQTDATAAFYLGRIEMENTDSD